MLSRRAFVTVGAALAALATTPARALKSPTHRSPGMSPLRVVFDRTLREGRAFGAAAERRGARVDAVGADLGSFWMRTLEPELKRGPLTLAGLTAGAPLFCLEVLCRDYGLSTVYRIEHRPTLRGGVEHFFSGDPALAPWTTRLVAAGTGWAAEVADLATTAIPASRPPTGIELLDLRAHERSAQSLFTWMIANENDYAESTSRA